MPLYRYKALNARGEMLDGQMEAATVGEVESRLPAPVWTDDLEIAGQRCRTGRSAGAGTCASCLGAKSVPH